MAKFESIFEMEGTLQGMTFYKTKNGERLIRKKGGVSKQRIKSDPAFQRTRENGQEFGHAAQMGQLMRRSVSSLVSLAKDNRMSSRMVKALNDAKRFDTTSVRGQRKVWIGLSTPEGKRAMKGFDFNANSSLLSVLKGQPVVDLATGTVEIADFIPSVGISTPEGATHASMRVAVANVDFEMANYGVTYSPEFNFPVDALLASDVTLTPTAMPAGTGVTFYLLLIAFFQEFNGTQYSLRNNSHNVLHILEVA
jgi:hypothetical protein